MREKHAPVKNIRVREENFSTEITLMCEESVEIVKQIEIECGLSPWTVEDYKQELLRKDSIALISKNKNIVNGFLAARLIMQKHSISDFSNEAEIYNIAVTSEFRKQGIGQALLDSFLSRAKAQNVSKVFLEVRESNYTAINFYQRNKFIKCGKRKNFYSSPLEDGIVMQLDLASAE
jgi:ribosomal-protein-alanine N-acetyltransferase